MADITSQDISTLQKLVTEKREALRAFRFEGAGSRSRNVREGRTLRREIARIMTEIRARELSAAKAQIASEAKTA